MGFLSSDSDGLDIKEIHKWLAVVWLIAGGPLILAALPIPAFDPLRKLFFPIVRRGKLLRQGESTGKGLQRFTVPQSFFTNFYVKGLIWTTALVFTSLTFAVTCSRPAPEEHSMSSLASQLDDGMRTDILGKSAILEIGVYSQEAWRLVFVLLLFEIHLTRRFYECLFLSVFDPSARINFLGYMTAIGTPREVAKVIASIIYPHCLSNILDLTMQASLRPDDESGQRRLPSSYTYSIPRGDWFKFVPCPHCLAEVGFYAGLLIAGGANSRVLWILFFSVSEPPLVFDSYSQS